MNHSSGFNAHLWACGHRCTPQETFCKGKKRGQQMVSENNARVMFFWDIYRKDFIQVLGGKGFQSTPSLIIFTLKSFTRCASSEPCKNFFFIGSHYGGPTTCVVGPVLGSGDTTKNSDGIISAFRAENLSSSGEKRQTTMTA